MDPEVTTAFSWLVSAAVVLQATAVGLHLARRPALFILLQFSAAHLLSLAARHGDRPWLLLVSAGLMLPVVLALARTVDRPVLPTGGVVVLAALCGWVLMAGVRKMDSDDLRPRPLVGGVWDTGYPLRMGPVPVLLKPRVRHARILSHQGELRLEWPRHAGREDTFVVLDNAGPAGEYRLLEGRAELVPLGTSRLGVRASFPPTGGVVRFAGVARRAEETRLLLVAHARGDLPAVSRLLAAVEEDPPDLIVLLGDMVEAGDYPGLLALRDLVDSLGVRTQSVPGEGERGPYGLRTYEAIFGEAHKLRQSAGVSAVLLDTSEARLPSIDPGGIAFLATMGGGLGTGAVFLHHGVYSQDEGDPGLLPEPRDRGRLLAELPKWGTKLVASTRNGPSISVDHDGVRHIAVGSHADRLEAIQVTLKAGRVASTEPLAVPRSGRLARSVRGHLSRWQAVTREHWGLGHLLALGFVGLPGCLLLAACVARVNRQRRRTDEQG